MFAQTRPVFKQERVYQRAHVAANAMLTLGERTITGMLSAGGRQFEDWSAAYRLFEKDRIKHQELFAPALKGVLNHIRDNAPLYTMMDDTLLRKRGRKISGTGWKRDPLGPAFHTNFVWGQSYLQISAVLPDFEVPGRARGIPIDMQHAPSAKKPRKNAPEDVWLEYKAQQKRCKLTAVGSSRLAELRKQIVDRKIVCAVDGGYTNKALFNSIPDHTVLIGRIRKDASLFSV
ncbi:MAG: transposase, partial [Peptococcaceae bacterium]|nr:transposase [Peptococcaceae bacterium]